MAVLKDLIVHGASRFLNGINTDAIHANLIDAQDGVFKTITTTTLDAQTITTDMLKANNARVSQTLTVDGTISTNKWEAANIANIGGNFYISPTGKTNPGVIGTITVTKTNTTTINGVSIGVYTLVVSGTFGVTSTSSTVWGPTSNNQSKVIFTGSISYPQITGTDLTTTGKKYPLGTCDGTMTAVSTGTNTLTGFTITGVNSPALDVFFKEVGVTSINNTVCSGYEMQISVYQSYSSSALRPIGILLTSYGKEKKQYIDIYGGANALGSTTEEIDTGFAEPSVRIGQLDGLNPISYQLTSDTTVSSNKKYYTYNTSTYEYTKVTPASGANPKSLGYYEGIASTTPSGWGIYTTNGFFKGKVVASAGRIGEGTAAWTIGNDGNNTARIFAPSTRAAWNTNASGIWIATDVISGGAQTGSAVSGQYASTDPKWYIKANGDVKFGELTYINGTLTVPAAKVNGTLSAATMQTNLLAALHAKINALTSSTATIGSWKISKGVMQHDTVGGTNGIWISADTDTSSNVTVGTSGARKDWRLLVNNKFGVTTGGVLYASGVSLSGAIEATSFTAKDYYNNAYRTRAVIDTNGLTVYDGSGVADANIQAKFGSTVQVGKKAVGYVSIASTGMDIYAGSSNINLAHFGYDSTETSTEESSSVISDSPFFSVGQRRTVISSERGDNATVRAYVSNRYNIDADQEMPVPPGSYSTIIGYDNVAIGPNSCAEGNNTIAYGADAHSEGTLTAAIGMSSHAEGCITEAFGSYSHAEGYNTEANRGYSHAEGWGTEANELYSHAEGYNTKANGGSSHAEGYSTKANGSYSHAGGSDTTANGYAQTVIGRYNIISPSSAQSTYDATVSPYAFIIGNGTGSSNANRSNALTVDWSGNLRIKGNIYVGCNADSSSGTGLLATSGGTLTGCLRIKPTSDSNWSEGIRIYPASNGWTTLLLGGTDNTADTGTSANSWSLHSYGGNFYLARNGSSTSSSAILSCVNNVWAWNGTAQGNISGTCSYPAGFASRTTGATWGNTIGTSFTSWNDSTGGSIDFRQDNPSSGKVSIKVDGRFYYNEGNTAVWGLTSANGYWGMTDPDGNTSSSCWIRTTQAGIIPYQSGGRGSGHNYVGTDSWYFSQGYIDNIHGVTLDFNAATISGTTTIGGVTRINNSLYCDILYAGSGVVNADLSVGGTVRSPSDKRIKTHLKYLNVDDVAARFVQQLRPAYYIKNNKPEVGFYAQDVQEADPWNVMVESDEKGMLNLSYTEIIAPLVSYCHSLEKRIKELEARK